MNRPIDLEHLFHHYAADHLQNAGKLTSAAEALAEKLYEEWADAPCPRVKRQLAARLVCAHERRDGTCVTLAAYARDGMEPPALLLDRFYDVGAACAAPLEALARDDAEKPEVRAQALGLLPALDEARAVRVCEDAVRAAARSDAFSELAAELLGERVDAAMRERLLDGYDAAPEFARMLILEVLCNAPGDASMRIWWKC